MHRHGIYLGAANGEPVFAPHEHGTLVLGPPRSGKTSSVVVPNVLAAAGAVVAVSTKRDVLDETHAARRRLGACLLFDPSGTVRIPSGVHAIGWSPLAASATWDGAVFMAESMVGASREGRDRVDSSHWTERAAALLSSVFHGAALAGAPLDVVVSAVNRRSPELFVTTLARHDATLALDLLIGITETEEREQSAIWSTASGALAGYRTGAALASAGLDPFDPERFVHGRSTLFITSPAEYQLHLAPLVAGIIRDVRTAAYEHNATTRSRSDPPVLLVLDELANIAPLHDLPLLIAEGASQGVVTLASLQDLSQARARFGTRGGRVPHLVRDETPTRRCERCPHARGVLCSRRQTRRARHLDDLVPGAGSAATTLHPDGHHAARAPSRRGRDRPAAPGDGHHLRRRPTAPGRVDAASLLVALARGRGRSRRVAA